MKITDEIACILEDVRAQIGDAYDKGEVSTSLLLSLSGKIDAALSAAPAVGVKATEWVADRETLAEAALDQSLPDGSVRALCLAKKGDVSELIESWAALTTEGKDNG